MNPKSGSEAESGRAGVGSSDARKPSGFWLGAGKRAVAPFGRMNQSAALGVLGIGVLFVALRWHSCDAPLIRDEGEYAYAAQLLRGGLAPYEHSFLQKPPMIVYSYALAGMVAPKLFWAPRLLACLFAAGATALLGYVARREFGAGFALPVMWLFTPMVLLPGGDQLIANTEMFLLLPLMACFACYAFSRGRTGGSGAWFLAGVFGALALGYKYTALPLLAVLSVGWSFEEWRQGVSSRHLCRHWLFGLLGAGLAAVAVLGFFLPGMGAGICGNAPCFSTAPTPAPALLACTASALACGSSGRNGGFSFCCLGPC